MNKFLIPLILVLSQLGWAEVSQVYISQQVGNDLNFSVLYENGKVNEVNIRRLPFNLILRFSDDKRSSLIYLIANSKFSEISKFNDKKIAFQWGDIAPCKVTEYNWLKSMEFNVDGENDFVLKYDQFLDFRKKNNDYQNVSEFNAEIIKLDKAPVIFWGYTRINRSVGGISTQTIKSLDNVQIEDYIGNEIIYYLGDSFGKETKNFQCSPVRLIKCKLNLP